MPKHTRTAGLMLLAACLLIPAGCRVVDKLPWRSQEMITDPKPSTPPIMLDTASGRHLVVMRVPTGGWTLTIDKAEIIPDGQRVFVTARRPDPAFMHTQAFVNLRALTQVPAETKVEVVARVLDRHADPKDSIYARVVPVESFDE
tara:strand:- start:28478 stop:28912 length:435 start_codon:yes stop_codon:yes gene_type:complete